MLPEIENIDVPGLDHYFEHNGIFYCWQKNTVGNSHSGRWVITDNITNPAIANTTYCNGDYYRIDQAIEKFKTNILECQK
jgi:hypothetical protein